MRKTARTGFTPLQAQRVNKAFREAGVDYLLRISGGFVAGHYRQRASNRAKDLLDLQLLEDFRREYAKQHAPPVETAAEKAARNTAMTKTRSRK